MLAVGAIPLLHEAGWLPFPVFLLLVALAGALRGPGDAAKAALTPAVVAAAGVPMERATGLHSTVERTAGLLGAAAAGGLVAVDRRRRRAGRRRAQLRRSPPRSWPGPPRVACARSRSEDADDTDAVRRASCARAGPSCAATGCCSASRSWSR